MSHRCSDPTCSGFDRQRIYKRVDKQHLQIVHVNGAAPFAYTIGAWHYHHQPELFIQMDTGGKPDNNVGPELAATLALIVEKMQAISAIEDGTPISLGERTLYLRNQVHDPRPNMGICRDYYIDRHVTRLENVPVMFVSHKPKRDVVKEAVDIFADLANHPIKSIGALLAFAREHFASDTTIVALTVEDDGHAYTHDVAGGRTKLEIVSLFPLLPNQINFLGLPYPLRSERPFNIIKDGQQRTLPVAPDETSFQYLHELHHRGDAYSKAAIFGIAERAFATDPHLNGFTIEFDQDGYTGTPVIFAAVLDTLGLADAFEYAVTTWDLATMRQPDRNIALARPQ